MITGSHAVVDPVAADRGFEIIVQADLAVKNRRTVEAFEARVAGFPEVTELQRMFGAPDYLIWVAIKDWEAYEHFLLHKLMPVLALARGVPLHDEGPQVADAIESLTEAVAAGQAVTLEAGDAAHLPARALAARSPKPRRRLASLVRREHFRARRRRAACTRC